MTMSLSDDKQRRFSKAAVDRAGRTLIDDPQNEDALEVLDYWRGLFGEPSDIVAEKLHRTLNEKISDIVDAGRIRLSYRILSRLKRTVSIIAKLKRMPSMRLSRMQDIGGIRYIVAPATVHQNDLMWFYAFLKQEQAKIANQFSIKKQDDYLSKPKDSGYRGAHLVFEYEDSSSRQYDGLPVEVQFRTKLQHLWAMAVETVGMFYGQALKASQGDQGWLDFFRLASAAISHVEKSPVVALHAEKSFEKIRNELFREGTEKSYFSKLSAIKEVGEKSSAEEYDYWLLELNIRKGENAIYGFKTNQLATAQEMYAAKEQTPACLRGDVQVVLVSTRSFNDLREAYPSYFLDVAEFTNTIKSIVSK